MAMDLQSELATPEEVLDGVWSIPIPLVGSPLASVTMYAVRHQNGILLVDAGYDHPECWAALVGGLALAGARPEDVTAVVLTHHHPDHVGLASRIREASGAWVAIHPLDALDEGRRTHGTFIEQLDTELRLAGVPDASRNEMVESSRQLAKHAHGLSADRMLADGDVIGEGGAELEVVSSPGHTRGHVCLLDRGRRLLFGGDLLLAAGEVQLGVVSTPEDDPVAELQGSLRRVSELDVDLLLPGHYDRIGDVAGRAAAVAAELETRLAKTADVIAALPGSTAWDVTEAFPWDRPWARQGTTARRFGVMQVMGWRRRLVSLGRAELEPGPPELVTLV